MGVTAPSHIEPSDTLEHFTSGVVSLDEWLKRRALHNEASGASRTYVVRETVENHVVGYYSLATGSIMHGQVTAAMKRNMPDPIPVILLGRLAVDQRYKGTGLGKALLKDAVLRVLQAASLIGVRAMLVHAISEDARQFYLRHGFTPCPGLPLTLMISLAGARQALS